jgi:hypothetical protein
MLRKIFYHPRLQRTRARGGRAQQRRGFFRGHLADAGLYADGHVRPRPGCWKLSAHETAQSLKTHQLALRAGVTTLLERHVPTVLLDTSITAVTPAKLCAWVGSLRSRRREHRLRDAECRRRELLRRSRPWPRDHGRPSEPPVASRRAPPAPLSIHGWLRPNNRRAAR